ncbi:Oligopeptide transport system permease OppC [Klebsiella pneumoniae]|uniref:Oligopeptide transport system permease OppC n=1 Tax=Klebsiella pneumoniae TaxID=573 RepID=A0A378H266_KLEPN|nr:Oligopeptide transport system permease OppC [Klebsiella pneumoniae]
MMLSKKNSEALENFSEKLEVEGRSLWQDARRRFMHNRAAVTSLIMLVLIAPVRYLRADGVVVLLLRYRTGA